MRILYCLPVFFEYRLPYLQELVRLFRGDFYVMYSPLRFRMCGKEGLLRTIEQTLGENAVPFTREHIFDTFSKRWDVMPDIEQGKRIPLFYGLGEAIRKIAPDILITEGYFQWTPAVLLYGLMHRVPVYMGYERTLHTERFCGRLKRLQRVLFNKFFSGFFVNGIETEKYLLSLGSSRECIHKIGISADSKYLREKVAAFKKEPHYPQLKKELRNNRTGLCFLFTGVVDMRKGVMPLLRAWRQHIHRHPNDCLIVVGGGAQLEECQEYSSDMPSVRFTGKIPYENVAIYLSVADVSIMPTVEDNWSLVVPEAMSCGLPVATSVYNGCHQELIKEGVNGYVFDTLQEDSIADVLNRFHSADLEAMGQASVELEKPFNTENCALRLYSTLTRLHRK